MLVLEQAFNAEREALAETRARADAESKRADEALAGARGRADAESKRADDAHEVVKDLRADRDKLQLQLAFARGTLSKRWVLEMALMHAHVGSTAAKSKFNATQTAGNLPFPPPPRPLDCVSRPSDWNEAAVDIAECLQLCNMNKADAVKLYGLLSADIHGSGVGVDSLLHQGTLTLNQHNFIKCVANKRFDIPV